MSGCTGSHGNSASPGPPARGLGTVLAAGQTEARGRGSGSVCPPLRQCGCGGAGALPGQCNGRGCCPSVVIMMAATKNSVRPNSDRRVRPSLTQAAAARPGCPAPGSEYRCRPSVSPPVAPVARRPGTRTSSRTSESESSGASERPYLAAATARARGLPIAGRPNSPVRNPPGRRR